MTLASPGHSEMSVQGLAQLPLGPSPILNHSSKHVCHVFFPVISTGTPPSREHTPGTMGLNIVTETVIWRLLRQTLLTE